MLKRLVIIVTVGVFAFVAYIGREEYGVALDDGRGRVRAVLSAVRVTFDSFVMGH